MTKKENKLIVQALIFAVSADIVLHNNENKLQEYLKIINKITSKYKKKLKLKNLTYVKDSVYENELLLKYILDRVDIKSE